jgi:hypothetical protein
MEGPPPIFTSATETITDLANVAINEGAHQPHHRLELLAESGRDPNSNLRHPPTSIETRKWKHVHVHRPVGQWDVHVDDFLGMVQVVTARRQRVKRALLHSLDKVFRGLSISDGCYRQEPASIKKLLKGDATWATRMFVLGWVLETTTKTIQLLPHRIERLYSILASITPNQRRTSTKKWQQVIGELRSMALAIPGAQGLSCSLQEALRHKLNDGTRVKLGRHVHAFLQDFRWLAEEISIRPTIMLKVVPSTNPGTRGACDA